MRHGLPIVENISFIITEKPLKSYLKFTHTFKRFIHCQLEQVQYQKDDISSENYPVICEKSVDNTSQHSVHAATFHCHFVTAQLLGNGGGAI